MSMPDEIYIAPQGPGFWSPNQQMFSCTELYHSDAKYKALEARIQELEEIIYHIHITEDSYDTEEEVLGEIYLLCESAKTQG